MTLTADELICHKICVTYDIETIYHDCTDFMDIQLLRSFGMTQIGMMAI